MCNFSYASCDYSYNTAIDGSNCGDRAASVRQGGRLGPYTNYSIDNNYDNNYDNNNNINNNYGTSNIYKYKRY